ncbi:aryl-alcohol dehydrogenase-like predicted oxidoreductase [Falsarthrobacter nasiphocae]|uniref:Aryl-alcohol dehydrogenase-like predicted oxidoreductase n=1 Tax=Falsarthrobacter nasiphocae TaxID=189863 RepID=A0AAE3YGI3_9MICC|nr:aryl-alcohol dehydrogenase-like predicted oxidoreductase [Falsarthrobacter nasiphocae]
METIDTADVYARGIAEKIVGRVLRGRRNVCVMTKVGLLKTPQAIVKSATLRGSIPALTGLRAAQAADRDYSSEYIKWAAENSLRRLSVDSVDTLLLHDIDAGSLKVGGFREAMENMQTRGLIRRWGAQVANVEAARAALTVPGLSVLQMPVNVTTGPLPRDIVVAAKTQGVNIVALAVLGDGRLLHDASAVFGDRSSAVAALVRDVLREDGVETALLGMSRYTHAYDNLAALRCGASAGEETNFEEFVRRYGKEKP